MLDYEWFDRIKEITINKKNVVELSVKQDKNTKYAYIGEGIPLRWFDKQMDSNTLASIIELKKRLCGKNKCSEETIDWLLQSSIDLEVAPLLIK